MKRGSERLFSPLFETSLGNKGDTALTQGCRDAELKGRPGGKRPVDLRSDLVRKNKEHGGKKDVL
jgi:hypothetical protein